MRVMLCGAADTRDLLEEFSEVVREFGAIPRNYLDGSSSSLNIRGASYMRNSTDSIDSTDLCVFVIYRDYGEITWHTEIPHILNQGRPFLMLAHQDIFDAYHGAKQILSDLNRVEDIHKRKLFLAMRDAELHHLTLLPFRAPKFAATLRSGLSTIFSRGLDAIATRADGEARLDLAMTERDDLARRLQAVESERVAALTMRQQIEGQLAHSAAAMAGLQSETDRLGDMYRRATRDAAQYRAAVDRRARLSFGVMALASAIGVVVGAIPTWVVATSSSQRPPETQSPHVGDVPNTTPEPGPTTPPPTFTPDPALQISRSLQQQLSPDPPSLIRW